MTDREMIEEIHAAMCVPFNWNADVLDIIADILTRNGYSFPSEEAVDELVEAHDGSAWVGFDGVPTEALAPWRPERRETWSAY